MTRPAPRPAVRRRRIVLGLLAALVAAAGLGSHAGDALIERRPLAAPDAIVILASHEWERLPAAAAIARHNPSSLVLLTLPRVVTAFNCHRCAERPAWLRQEGVAADHIVQLPWTTSNTYDEALAVSQFALRHPIRRLLIVTSPYHTRRALHVFETVLAGRGIAIGIEPASALSPADPDRWWWHPYDRWYVTHEWLGTLYYRLRYHVPIAGDTSADSR